MYLALALALAIAGSVLVDLYPDGSLIATYELSLSDYPVRVSLKTLPGAYAVFAYSNDTPMPFEYNSTSGLVEFPATSERAKVRVYHMALTEKRGLMWKLSLPAQEFPTSLLMPRGALIVSLEPKEFEALAVGDRLLLKFPAGRPITVEYVVPPPSPPSLPPSSPFPQFPPLSLAAAGALALAAVAAYVFYRRRAGRAQGAAVPEELDSRDRAILEAVEKGELSAQEIMRETGIPKTPLYRRLEKLEKMGLVERVQKGGVTLYRRRRSAPPE
ncbi:MAG: winged helix-turn-helix domain-containing protein [Acidilobaceae archaeon]|nr:winged helix-turn-helix domain-containing protein [Acidilobaceae archaeon]